jgi:hypothetical protein
MSTLDEFLGAAAVAPGPPSSEVEKPEEPVSDEPRGVVEIILPSGIEVYFQEHPKRLYRIRMHPDSEHEIPEGVADIGDPYAWREVVSCSTITGILDKPGLVHWGEEMGVKGMQELIVRGYVDLETVSKWSVEMIRDVMKQKGLRHWQMRDKAGKRGTSVHKALEGWAMSGNIVDPELFPAEEQGYVVGVNRFIHESGLVPLKSEVIVASLLHGFAGRFDLFGKIPEPVKISTKLTRADIEHRSLVHPDTFLVDLKTSSGVFEEYHLQVAGYQGACIESGYEKPNQTAILRVSDTGKYEFVPGNAEWLDFWWAKGLYDSLQSIKERGR